MNIIITLWFYVVYWCLLERSLRIASVRPDRLLVWSCNINRYLICYSQYLQMLASRWLNWQRIDKMNMYHNKRFLKFIKTFIFCIIQSNKSKSSAKSFGGAHTAQLALKKLNFRIGSFGMTSQTDEHDCPSTLFLSISPPLLSPPSQDEYSSLKPQVDAMII